MKKIENNDQDEEIVDWKIENMPEVIIDYTNVELVSVNIKKHPIYVMNIRYIIEGSITFKFGMEGVYFIRNKIIYDSMTIVIQSITKNEFQLNTFQNIITNMSDVEWFSKNGTEIIKENGPDAQRRTTK